LFWQSRSDAWLILVSNTFAADQSTFPNTTGKGIQSLVATFPSRSQSHRVVGGGCAFGGDRGEEQREGCSAANSLPIKAEFASEYTL
jgi:hypothetical protein